MRVALLSVAGTFFSHELRISCREVDEDVLVGVRLEKEGHVRAMSPAFLRQCEVVQGTFTGTDGPRDPWNSRSSRDGGDDDDDSLGELGLEIATDPLNDLILVREGRNILLGSHARRLPSD